MTVSRVTSVTQPRDLEAFLRSRSFHITFRASLETVEKLYWIMEKLNISRSEAVRFSIETAYAVLSSGKTVSVEKRVEIVNPVVNIHVSKQSGFAEEEAEILRKELSRAKRIAEYYKTKYERLASLVKMLPAKITFANVRHVEKIVEAMKNEL